MSFKKKAYEKYDLLAQPLILDSRKKRVLKISFFGDGKNWGLYSI